MMLPLLLLVAAQTASAIEPVVPREVHVFHDWVIACDNGRRCQGVGVHPEGREFEGNGVMMIERGPQADAPLVLRLTQVEGSPARLAVYNEALPVRLTSADGDFMVEVEDRSALMERILYAEQIDVQDSNGTAMGAVSVKGLRQALLYMDEAQGRLHTPTALIRIGRRPASDVPPAPAVPTVRLAPPTRATALAIPRSRIAQLRRDARCTINEVGGPDEAEVHALDERRTLVLLACGTGAYNLSVVPFVATRQGGAIRIDPAPFDAALKEWEEEEGHRILVNGGWDPESMTIGDFAKGRGLGDCGSRSTYGWDGERFRLVTREEMPECRGSTVYVTTWRAEVTR